jgi:hypothetical protein
LPEEGIHGCTDRDIGKENPFPKAQGKRGHPEGGVKSVRRKGFYHEPRDLRSRREIGCREYITREGTQRKELRANAVQGLIRRCPLRNESSKLEDSRLCAAPYKKPPPARR